MFQTFEVRARPELGPPRLAALREEMAKEGLDGFLVPRADAHQGEYVAPHDNRLAWLTGFTGSAGFCAALRNIAGVFVDGRYRVQVRNEVAVEAFTPVDWPEVKLAVWLAEHLPDGGVLGIDPWLHTVKEVRDLRAALPETIEIREVANLVDRVWEDQPPPPMGEARDYPVEFAGKTSGEKRAECAGTLSKAGHRSAVLTLPDSISWLLNIRGSDIPRIPIVQAFAVLHDDGRVDLFCAPEKVAPLGPDPAITITAPSGFAAALAALTGPVRIDAATAPLAVLRALEAGEVAVAEAEDPCVMPKACKTEAEIRGTSEAHLRDGAAMANFLAWLDREGEALVAGRRETLTEIDVATALEGFRRASNSLEDISFETIAGAGPNGAIVHYRVNETTNRAVRPGELMLVDSGGQYLDGTTDITRTIAIGAPPEDARAAFTRVLKGMIAISRARFPQGIAGRDLDVLARIELWRAGQDYGHGTGHGVGVFLGVHEGPQRISRASDVPLKPGMILSNEPGYYREGAFGIRIENLIVVQAPEPVPGGDDRPMLGFQTLTFAPIDRKLILAALLTTEERTWLDNYHAEVLTKIGPRVDEDTRAWLRGATAPIADA